ncbi:MAG: glycerol kinase GlpK [Bdellovibrionales bacterium]|jgi:glycerol kinase|nr:glycerol kinase GlpK [Bdellovibrionales bacterium]
MALSKLRSSIKSKTKNRYILAIDQGTTGTTVSLMTTSGSVVARADRDYRQHYPKPGWVEHKPDEIWKSVTDTLTVLLKKSRSHLGSLGPEAIAAIGITNQRETVVLWDRKTGKAIGNAIVWQDRRTTEECERLKREGHEAMVKAKTGLVLDPYFSATKVKWMLDNTSGLRARAERGEIAMGTIDTYLLWRLTGGRSHKTDVSNASRTLLMNLESCQWDEELLKLFGIPASMLPSIESSSGDFGATHGMRVLPNGIPITGIAGDQQAALFGQACFDVGEAKCTFGTGSFLLINTGEKRLTSASGLLTTAAWRLKGDTRTTYALEGGAFICGAAVQFLRDQLGFIKESKDIEKLAKTVPDTAGVEFVPALTGLGAPHWDPRARGLIAGLTRGTTKAHIARATLEAMALQNAEILEAMAKDVAASIPGAGLKSVRVDGGASANQLLMQLQADYLGVDVVRPRSIETTSAGAAFIAGHGADLFGDLDSIRAIWKTDKIFKPKMTSEARASRLEAWSVAVNRAKV